MGMQTKNILFSNKLTWCEVLKYNPFRQRIVMKLICVVLLLTLLVYGATSTSPMHCEGPCEKHSCPVDGSNCPCGTYKDECGCCDFCIACSGQKCNLLSGQRCEGKQVCRPPLGASFVDVQTGKVSSVCQ
ncbi:8.6 kDa transglutaminase substrate-like isoform X1 [Tachypleus tridentatus]|uniref:8.6 kDa transglutaminase substrate-like isoform X1 n=2 Tax=Tachypleus tridentatus TaxID=6853 RepID=UPI003FD613A4